MSYSIIVDLSHKEKIEEFPDFALDEEDYEIDYIDKNEGPIDFEMLEDYDVLFIGNIQATPNGKDDKFTKEELLNDSFFSLFFKKILKYCVLLLRC